MAYIHDKKNKSGTTSVVVRYKDGGKSVDHSVLGAAVEGTPEYEELLLRAREVRKELTGEYYSLFDEIPDDPCESVEEESTAGPYSAEDIAGVLSSIGNRDVHIVGPELVFGYIYDKIGYGALGETMFRHLVLCRLFNPGSKRRTVDYLNRYLGIKYDVSEVYGYLDDICPPGSEGIGMMDKESGEYVFKKADTAEGGLKSKVEDITFRWTRKVLKWRVTAVFYDCTTLYFETEEDDSDKDGWRKLAGWNKDGKHSNPQIVLGLLVAADGNAIGYEVFEGNVFEGHTLIGVLERFCDRFKIGKPVVVADAGLLSKKNTKLLEDNGYDYILGARLKNMDEKVKGRILALDMKDGDVETLKLEGGRRLVVSKTASRERRDWKNAKKGVARLEKKYKAGTLTKESINNRGYNKYLKMDGKVYVTIDYDKIREDEAWFGIKGYETNTRMHRKNILATYHDLWRIERCFRMNKTDLKVRPIRHRLFNRIMAHICICFVSYTIEKEMDNMLARASSPLSYERVMELVRTMYSIDYRLPGSDTILHQMLGMDAEQEEALRVVQFDKDLQKKG